MMNNTFLIQSTTGSDVINHDMNADTASGFKTSPNVSQMCFDTFSQGFELPASMQLNRMNSKLYRFDRNRLNLSHHAQENQ